MDNFTLIPGMKLGVATASTQIEGGKVDSNWQDWYERGKISDGSSPENADGHYERVKPDVELMKKLKLQCCRFGVEWARIEPQRGVFDEKALEHYRNEIILMKEAGIEPLLTLHHFSNPMWFERMGAFEKQKNIALFLEFVDKTVRYLGDLVSEYITINEPNVYAVNGYMFGSWPPGKKSFSTMRKVMVNLTEAHISAYAMIHAVRDEMGLGGTKVSFANHLRVFEPEKNNFFNNLTTAIFEQGFQTGITRAMMAGVFEWPLKKPRDVKPGLYCDFIAVNYYTRSTISGVNNGTAKNVPVNDLGWEIFPKGITDVMREPYIIAPLPIYVTENGTCDEKDAFRSRYIYEHLKELCESGYPIKKYFHWCFIDNFEWVEGESARFGIVKNDFETQKRTLKKSGEFYREIIENEGVTAEMYERYVKDESYNNN